MNNEHFRWTLLRQALTQKKTKALLIVLAVAMGASVVASLLNLNLDLRSRMNRELRDYGPNVLIQPDSADGYRTVHVDVASALRSNTLGDRLLAFSPEIIVPGQVEGQAVILMGANLPELAKLYPNWIWSPYPEADISDGAFVGVRAAKRLQLAPGATARIETAGKSGHLKVIGLVESGETEDDQLFVSLPVAESFATEPGYHALILSVLGELNTVEKKMNSFVANHSGIRYQIIRKIAQAESLILDRIANLMGLIISLIFIILFFCIHTTVSAILISRQSEIALFRVLGARRRQIMLGLTSELLILSIAGGFLGFAIGMMMAQILGQILFKSWILPRLSIFVVTIVFSMIMVMLSSIIPILRAANRQAAMVLKEV